MSKRAIIMVSALAAGLLIGTAAMAAEQSNGSQTNGKKPYQIEVPANIQPLIKEVYDTKLGTMIMDPDTVIAQKAAATVPAPTVTNGTSEQTNQTSKGLTSQQSRELLHQTDQTGEGSSDMADPDAQAAEQAAQGIDKAEQKYEAEQQKAATTPNNAN